MLHVPRRMDYKYIFLPLIAAIIAQIIKLIINGVKNKFSWAELNSYGGMPSSHAALVITLTTLIGYYEGWTSAVFAVAFVFAVIVIRDAGGFRRALGRHATELNQIIHALPGSTNYPFTHLNERMGHTPLELFFGSLLGLIVTTVFILLF